MALVAGEADGDGEGNCGKRDNHFRLEKHALAPHMDSLQDGRTRTRTRTKAREMDENEDNKYPTYTQLQLKYFLLLLQQSYLYKGWFDCWYILLILLLFHFHSIILFFIPLLYIISFHFVIVLNE